jgi:glycosyltransferase involved in cell wall biosynthesis
MQNKHNKRICIVTNALGGGGLERVAAMQSVYLADSGYSVFVVSNLDNIAYPYKGELLNLGKLKNQSNSLSNRIKRFNILKRFIKEKRIDLIIDHRPRTRWLSEWLISNFLYTKPTIYVVHSFKVSNYIPTKNSFLNRQYKTSKSIVSVSKGIEGKIKKEYDMTNVHTIYNPIDLKKSKTTISSEKLYDYDYILWYGRIDDNIKNLKLLIDAYKISELPKRNYKLILLGNGPDENKMKHYVSDNNLQENVVFVNRVLNPLVYVKSSKFVILTSKYEGYPMVLPESLSCGVSVVSVDCQSGPSEIINHRENGLLVENNNELALSEAMNEFISNEALYEKCKRNAQSSVSHLDVSIIREQWIKIIENE